MLDQTVEGNRQAVIDKLQQTYESAKQRHQQHVRDIIGEEPVRHRPQVARPRFENFEERNDKRVQNAQNPWLWTANVLIEQRIDPVDYIRRHFARLSPGTTSPSPSQLGGAKSLQEYRTAVTNAVVDVRADFRSQVMRFQTRARSLLGGIPYFCPDKHAAWLAVLQDPMSDLSALFRYCMAHVAANDAGTPEPHLFEQFAVTVRIEAALQYISAPEAYDTVWQGFLPPNWAERADTLYQQHFGLNNPTENFDDA